MAPTKNASSSIGPSAQKKPVHYVTPALPLLPRSHKKATEQARGTISGVTEEKEPVDTRVPQADHSPIINVPSSSVVNNNLSNGVLSNEQSPAHQSVLTADDSISVLNEFDDANLSRQRHSDGLQGNWNQCQPLELNTGDRKIETDRSNGAEIPVGHHELSPTPAYQPLESSQAASLAEARNGRNGASTTSNGFFRVNDTVVDVGSAPNPRRTPQSSPVILEISPMTNRSNDNLLAELSAHTTPVVFSSTAPAVSPMASHLPALPQFMYDTSSVSQISNGAGHVYPEAVINTNHSIPYKNLPAMNNHYRAASQVKPFPTILDHMIHLANSKQLADWVVRIDQPGGMATPYVTYAHRFVLLRSERIASLMARVSNEPAYETPILVFTPPRPIQPHAFEAALRFLYTDTILSAEALFPRDTYMDRHARAHVVDYALSYWMAGIELDLEPIISRSFSLLASTVDWDVAELLVREAFALRAHQSTQEDTHLRPNSHVMGGSILQLVFGLFIHRFDAANFRLDTGALPVTMPARLNRLDPSKASTNPALAGMVFGSMPSSADMSPTSSLDGASWSAETAASNILLNLEFADLAILSKELMQYHAQYGTNIVAEVIEERERRRLQFFSDHALSIKERRIDPAVWDIVGWQESFKHGRLHRDRVGFVPPIKNGEGQSRNS